jgi:hypothetical protein
LQALANKNELADVIQKALLLKQNSKAADNQLTKADDKMTVVSLSIHAMVDKLIYSAEIINKLSAIIVRKKVLTP